MGKIAEELQVSTEVAAYSIAEAVEDSLATAAQAHAAEHGLDLHKHVLVAFGGAAPLRAARLAERLGIETVLVPPDASVGSAMGFFSAPLAFEALESCTMRLKDFDHRRINAIFRQLWHKTVAVVAAGAARWKPGRPPKERRRAYMRYVGQGHEICVDLPNRDLEPDDPEILQKDFELVYTQMGYIALSALPGLEIEFRAFALEVVADADPLAWPQERLRAQKISQKSMLQTDAKGTLAPAAAATACGKRRVYDGKEAKEVEYPVYLRAHLPVGALVCGPAVITEAYTTTIVTETFDCWILENGFLQLQVRDAKHKSFKQSLSPTSLGYGNEGDQSHIAYIAYRLAWTRLVTVVEEQAEAILRNAFSPLLRESRAVICAIVNASGDLMVQSEISSPGLAGILLHIVASSMREGGLEDLSPQESMVRICPGSMPKHSDLVVITPVFEPHCNRPSGFVVSAAHIAEAPVSSCAFNREDLCKLGAKGAKDAAALMAANELSCERLKELLVERSAKLADLGAYIFSESEHAIHKKLQDIAGDVVEQKRKITIREVPEGHTHTIDVGVQVQRDGNFLDVKLFCEGQSGAVKGSAFLCAAFSKFACMASLGQGVPVNKGSLDKFRVHIPPDSLLEAPVEFAAEAQVAHCLPDLILHCISSLKPFSMVADSASFLCTFQWDCDDSSGLHIEGGGMGAQADQDGVNSTIYPCGFQSIPLEIAETSNCFLFNCKELIKDSGGAGCFRGGLGLRCELMARRELRASATLGCSINGPLGREGGAPGRSFFMEFKQRSQLRQLPDSACEKGNRSPKMLPGDLLLLETPGGAGYGPPAKRCRKSLMHDMEEGYVSAAAASLYETKGSCRFHPDIPKTITNM